MTKPPSPPKPIPEPDGLNAEFYEQCTKGRLYFQRCTACEAWRHLPRDMCPKCGSADWEWSPSSGRGKIYSWTVTHRAMHPSFAGDVPYAVVVV